MKLSYLTLRISIVDLARRRLCIIRSCRTIGGAVLGLHEFRPNGLPIIGTKHVAGDLSIGRLLDWRTVFYWHTDRKSVV